VCETKAQARARHAGRLECGALTTRSLVTLRMTLPSVWRYFNEYRVCEARGADISASFTASGIAARGAL